MVALAVFLTVLPFVTALGMVIAICILLYTIAYGIYDRLHKRCSSIGARANAFDRFA